jgi:hypothetical protein
VSRRQTNIINDFTAVPFFKITLAVAQEYDSIDHQCKKEGINFL